LIAEKDAKLTSIVKIQEMTQIQKLISRCDHIWRSS